MLQAGATRSFGEDLRHWRALRRLSQLDLALRAGTTQRHLSFIERGRSMPGRDVVLRLAESLGLPLRERNALLQRAGYAAAYSEGSSLDDRDLGTVRSALEDILHAHEPYPAMIIDRSGELVSANRACSVFFEDVDPELLSEPVNTRRLALHPRGLAPRIINFASWAPHVTEGLRRELQRNPDPSLEQLLEELEQYLPSKSMSLGFAIGAPLELQSRNGILRLLSTLTVFANVGDVLLSEVRLEAFLPSDDLTAERLRDRSASAAAESAR